MDLLATVKKEGSRGGTADFKWSDVQSSSHREHYLGHSLMAPVGRWQRGRDLNWYAKSSQDHTGEGISAEEQAARERADEIRKVKEAEQDAMARALGLPVPDRSNPNTEALGNRKDLEKVVKDGAGDGDSRSKGIGYSTIGPSLRERAFEDVERIEGNAELQDKELNNALKEYRRRHGDKGLRRRSRSRSRDPDRKHSHRPRDRDRDRDRDRKHQHHHTRRQRSRSYSAGRYRRRGPTPEHSYRGRRDRSRSPKSRSYDQR